MDKQNNSEKPDIGGEIIKSIQILAGYDNSVQQDYECIVLRKNDTKTYTVSINSQEYKARNITNINLSPFDTVLVHCVNGNFGNKVIIGKY